MLTEKQYKLLMFINKVLKETGCSPSFEEMKEAVGLKSKSGIHALITALEERNFIKKLPHRARALEVVRLPKFKPSASLKKKKSGKPPYRIQQRKSPFTEKLRQEPVEALPTMNEKVSVPFEMVNRGLFYALTIEGDSMIEAGILDGDTVIIKKTDSANNGEIAVALVDDCEATLKVIKRDKNDILLIPCNKDYQTRRLPANRVKIQGVLSGLLRQYH